MGPEGDNQPGREVLAAVTPSFSEGSAMRITYDPEADALYIELRQVPAHDSLDIEEGVTADLDAEGHIIGLEVLDARERLGNEVVTSAPVEMCETCIHADPRKGTMLVYCRHIERLRVLTTPACADYAAP